MLHITDTQTADVLAIFGLPGHWEIVIIVLAILLLFGGKKLPELARGLGRGLRLFRNEVKGIRRDIEEDEKETEDKNAAESEDRSSKQ